MKTTMLIGATMFTASLSVMSADYESDFNDDCQATSDCQVAYDDDEAAYVDCYDKVDADLKAGSGKSLSNDEYEDLVQACLDEQQQQVIGSSS